MRILEDGKQINVEDYRTKNCLIEDRDGYGRCSYLNLKKVPSCYLYGIELKKDNPPGCTRCSLCIRDFGYGDEDSSHFGPLEYVKVFEDLECELGRATNAFQEFATYHEGMQIIREEYLELEKEVHEKRQDKSKMRKEALQVAAMALRFIIDLCDTTEIKDGRRR